MPAHKLSNTVCKLSDCCLQAFYVKHGHTLFTVLRQHTRLSVSFHCELCLTSTQLLVHPHTHKLQWCAEVTVKYHVNLFPVNVGLPKSTPLMTSIPSSSPGGLGDHMRVKLWWITCP